MDALAAEGTWFDRAYSPYPVCCPSRVCFLTDRFPPATGIRDNGIDDPPRHEQHLFDLLNAAGYKTALCGKNHTHLDASDADYWYETSHWGGSPRTDEEAACDEWLSEHDRFGLEPNPYPPAAQPGGRAVGEALAWLSEASEPFFLWLSIPEPHPPYHVPEPYISMFPPDSLPQSRRARRRSRRRALSTSGPGISVPRVPNGRSPRPTTRSCSPGSDRSTTGCTDSWTTRWSASFPGSRIGGGARKPC